MYQNQNFKYGLCCSYHLVTRGVCMRVRYSTLASRMMTRHPIIFDACTATVNQNRLLGGNLSCSPPSCLSKLDPLWPDQFSLAL